MKRVRLVKSWLGPLALLACGFASGSCGKASDAPPLQLDSNTNWLKRCDADDQCDGSLRCYCGQCSLPCAGGDECSLLAGAECAASGGAVCSEQPGAGGLCVLGCSTDQDCGLDFACTQGQCVAKPCTGTFLSADDLYANVATDVARVDVDALSTTRYITLANHSAYRGCESTLRAERQGLSKLLNSLSPSALITRPQPVDAEETIYRIDLRDYGWNRPVVLRGVGYSDVWEALAILDPYAVPMIGDDADDASADTQTLIPLLFASSLMATATTPDVYAALLELPQQLEPFYTSLGVDSSAPDARAGFILNRETVASHFQMQSRIGFVWQSWAWRAADGALFDDPLGTPEGDREIVFSLPNGLSGFSYTDRFGARLDSSPDFIDPGQPDFRSQAPLSGLRRHPSGVSLPADEVRASVDGSPARFDANTLAAIRAAYPGAEAIAELVRQETEYFMLPALAGAGVDPALPEPISAVIDEFNRDVDLDTAAGELLVTRELLEQNLNLLPPAMQVLDGGRLPRLDFAELYLPSLCVLSTVQSNMPDPTYCFP